MRSDSPPLSQKAVLVIRCGLFHPPQQRTETLDGDAGLA